MSSRTEGIACVASAFYVLVFSVSVALEPANNQDVISFRSSTANKSSYEKTPIVCGENEIFFNCVNGGCLKRNCSDKGRPILCIDLIEGACEQGCICRKDYLRASNGTCVPSEECPKEEVCSKPHEYYDPCTPSCPKRDCGYRDSETDCPPKFEVSDPQCTESCRCEEGFYRKYSQGCVPMKDCWQYYSNDDIIINP